MSKCNLTAKQSQVKALYRFLEGQRVEHDLNQEDVANVLGYHQSNYNRKIKQHTLSTLELITLFELYNTDTNKIGELLKVKK